MTHRQSGTVTYRALGAPRASSLEGTPLASFRARAFAFAIDLFVVLMLVTLVGLPYALSQRDQDPSGRLVLRFEPFDSLWGLAILVLYFGLSTYLGGGQTLGKRLLRIRVASLIHDRLSLWHCLERALGYGASALEGGFGFIQYFIHPNRQTVHDRIAETIVVGTEVRTNDLSRFPVTRKWPARHADRLQLYSLPTPNGVKVSIMLEETGLPYEPHRVEFEANDQHSPEFLSLSPNNKVPAILDPDGPGGRPLALFESGAILIYLSEKTGKFMPSDPAGRYETIQWLMFQMGGIGPMFGQVGFFHKFAGRNYEDKRPRDRYVAESKRLLGVLDRRLADRAWVMGDDYSIADIAIFPWVNNLVGFYGASDLVGIADFQHVTRALRAFLARPAVVRGLEIPGRSEA
jgi:GST-like protein